jgi:hypothetical protein
MRTRVHQQLVTLCSRSDPLTADGSPGGPDGSVKSM